MDGRVEGSITIDRILAENPGAHLRWFIVSDALRGTGVGRQLVDAAIACCRDRSYARVYLTFGRSRGSTRLDISTSERVLG